MTTTYVLRVVLMKQVKLKISSKYNSKWILIAKVYPKFVIECVIKYCFNVQIWLRNQCMIG